MCKHKSLIVKGRQQEHEANSSKFPQVEVKAHEDALLYWMTYSWEKCDLLGLDDQKKVLDDIREEVGFESDQSDDKGQNEGAFLEEIHDEAFESTSYDDIESVQYSLLQNEQRDRHHDLLSDLINDNPVIHDDY